MGLDIKHITKLPPKQLAMVVVGGVGAGLLWRRYLRNKGGTAVTTDPSSDLNSAVRSTGVGNLADAQSSQVPATNDAVRDVGQSFFPTLGGSVGTLSGGNSTGIVNLPAVITGDPNFDGPAANPNLPTVSTIPALNQQIAATAAWYARQPASFKARYRINDAGTGVTSI